MTILHDNKDMDTQCIYIDHVFSLIGNGKKYHIFLKENLIYSFCGSGPASKSTIKQMARLGSICQNCYKEFTKDL